MEIFPYGTVLKIQREYALADVFASLKSIRDLGLNFVVLWPAVYWWEAKSPQYPYRTGCEILQFAEKIGLKLIMELAGQLTSLEYAPDFIMKDEYFMTDRNGDCNRGGWYYTGLNYNHPAVKRIMRKQFSRIAANYKQYPSLYGYDIWNETAFTSYDKYTLQLFRSWLRDKYKTIDRLNAIWDRVYRKWSDIEFTRLMWASVMPVVDYEQFHKENVGLILREWRGIIKSVDPVHPVIADNIGSILTNEARGYDRPQDDWNVAANVDEFGISFYPKNNLEGEENYRRWETLAATRSAAGGRFWISEMQSHNQSMFNPFSVVHPHELRWWNWEAVAHGAKGIIYWKWHPFSKGIQTSGRGLVDVRGDYTPRAREAAAIRKAIAANEEEFLSYQPERARVAVLYDTLAHDLAKAYTIRYKPLVPDSMYVDSIGGLYRCLWEQGLAVDFITRDDILSGLSDDYRVLFATNQLYMDDGLALGLRRYTDRGGVLICDAKFGMVGADGILHKDLPGGGLNSLLGFRLVDVDPVELDITLQWDQDTRLPVKGFYEKQYLEVLDEKVGVIGRFPDGSPAILRSAHGKGQLLYIATFLWYGYFKKPGRGVDDFVRLLANEYDLHTHTVTNDDLKLAVLRGGDGLILFAFNYTGGEVLADAELRDIVGDRYSVKDLYTGDCHDRSVHGGRLTLSLRVEARGVTVLKMTREG